MAEHGKGRKQPPRPAAQPSWEEFAHAMRRLYDEANLTGRQLTAAAQVSKSATSRYLRGQSFPPQRFVDALVTLGLERLNRNTDYVTVDIDAELRHWQTAWAYVERARHNQGSASPASPDTPPPSDTAAPTEPGTPPASGGWRAVPGAAVAIGSAIAAFVGARRGSTDRAVSRPASPTSTSPPVAPSSPEPGVWRPTPVQKPKRTNQTGNSSDAQGPRPTRRHIWTYSDHVRRQQGE